MHIKWSSLIEVTVVSFGVGVAIVVIFAIGVLAWSQRPGAGESLTGDQDTATGRGGVLTTAAAGLCFLACALIVCYGIYIIVPQFH